MGNRTKQWVVEPNNTTIYYRGGYYKPLAYRKPKLGEHYFDPKRAKVYRCTEAVYVRFLIVDDVTIDVTGVPQRSKSSHGRKSS